MTWSTQGMPTEVVSHGDSIQLIDVVAELIDGCRRNSRLYEVAAEVVWTVASC